MAKSKVIEPAVAAAEESAAASQASSKSALVVCSYAGFGDAVSGLWDRMLPDHQGMKILTVDGDCPLKDLAAECIADDSVADEFVLVPPMAVPCSPMAVPEILLPVCFVDVRGGEHFSHRLPVLIRKEKMAEVLADMPGRDDEDVMREYYSRHLTRAVRVSFREGNFVTPVFRGTPCMSVVDEAILRKKYIIANDAGMTAIFNELQRVLKI